MALNTETAREALSQKLVASSSDMSSVTSGTVALTATPLHNPSQNWRCAVKSQLPTHSEPENLAPEDTHATELMTPPVWSFQVSAITHMETGVASRAGEKAWRSHAPDVNDDDAKRVPVTLAPKTAQPG